MLMIVANGNGGQVNPGDSIFVDNNFSYQGGLYGTNAVEFGNNVKVDGPIVGSQIILANNLATNAFPTISIVPVGMPSNEEVYAQPNPPQGFTGSDSFQYTLHDNDADDPKTANGTIK